MLYIHEVKTDAPFLIQNPVHRAVLCTRLEGVCGAADLKFRGILIAEQI